MQSPEKFIWFGTLVVAINIIIFSRLVNNIRMQDMARSTKEANTAHVQVENFALDAMDMHIGLKHEGIAIIKDEDIPKVRKHVQTQVELFEEMKGDIQNLRLENVEVFPGTYGILPGTSVGETVHVQTIDEVPYYKATLRGEIIRLIRGAGESKVIPFREEIFVRASHLTRVPE